MAKGPLRSDTCKWKSCCPPPELPPLPATLPQWTEWSAGQVCEPGVTLQSALPHAPLGIHPGLSPLHSTPLPVVFLNCTSDPCTLFLKMSPTCTKTKALCGLESMWSALASLDGLHVALLPLPALQTQATPFFPLAPSPPLPRAPGRVCAAFYFLACPRPLAVRHRCPSFAALPMPHSRTDLSPVPPLMTLPALSDHTGQVARPQHEGQCLTLGRGPHTSADGWTWPVGPSWVDCGALLKSRMQQACA